MDALDRLLSAQHHNPFEVLSWTPDGDSWRLRVLRPDADEINILALPGGEETILPRSRAEGLFEAVFPERFPYRIRAALRNGPTVTYDDPYAFTDSLFGDVDLYLFSQGDHEEIYKKMGAVTREINGIAGYNFSVWAPNADGVSVAGPFNNWDGRIHQMRVLGNAGIWELFIPGIQPGLPYKFEIRTHGGRLLLKSDPYGALFELRPKNASLTTLRTQGKKDSAWHDARKRKNIYREPVSIYEVHLGSWRKRDGWEFLSYRELAEQLVDYVKDMGFNYLELLPIGEHPFDSSWGYQTTGFYAPTSRHGSPEDFRFFIDYCHAHDVGVILDWPPAHFPKDDFSLYRFDGTHLYEHADPRQRDHPDWGSAIFNYERHEVENFLLGSALHWMDDFDADGLRADAVASLLYLDYSRKNGEWIPNKYGGRENLAALDFIKKLNAKIYRRFPYAAMIAEESTAWPGVSKPIHLGGLGFGFKWNLGWMHDTLSFFARDPVHRKYHHQILTFSLLYAFTENFVLPLSHDEVVHGKGSLLHKMPGDDWQKFANLRLLFGWQFGHPGKKLIFMGGEFGQRNEWDCMNPLAWDLLGYAPHRGIAALVRDLNRLYREYRCLHEEESSFQTFQWIDFSDTLQSIISFIRWDARHESFLIFIFNLTPLVRTGYRLGVPVSGTYREILNSNSSIYGGSNQGNLGLLSALPTPSHGLPSSVTLTLPPLGFLVLSYSP